MGFYLGVDHAQPGGARPGPGAPGRDLLDRLRARLSRLEPAADARRPGPPDRGRLPRRRGGPASALLLRALPRPARRRTARPEPPPRRSRRGWRWPTKPAEDRVPSPRVRLRADPGRRAAAGGRARRGEGRRPRPRARACCSSSASGCWSAPRASAGSSSTTYELARTLGTIGLVLILFEGGLTAGWKRDPAGARDRDLAGDDRHRGHRGDHRARRGLAVRPLDPRGPDDRLRGRRHRQRRDLRRPARLAPAQARSRARSRASRG